MFTKDEPITLTNLGGGAAVEKFDEELQRVLDNIVDPNTQAESVRSITLKVTIKPDNTRQVGTVLISSVAKLAPDKEYETTCALGAVNGKGVARELREQGSLFDLDGADNVVGIDQAGGGE